MATATTTPTTQCPACGAKIPSTVSICPYCVTPLSTGGARSASADRTPVMERLAHMKEKPEYAEGIAWTPMEGPQFQRATARRRTGIALAAIGLLLAASAIAGGRDAASLFDWRFLLGAALIAGGLWAATAATRVRREIRARPLLKRPARVADRRSETSIHGRRGDTTYFFELEFEDGTTAEFCFPGRGAADNPLTNGVTGIAYTRGQELVAFKRVRV